MDALKNFLNDSFLFEILSTAIKLHIANKKADRFLIKHDHASLLLLTCKLTTPFRKGKAINELLFNILQYTDTFSICEQLMAFIDQFKSEPNMFIPEYDNYKMLLRENTNVDLINSPTVHKFTKIIAMGNHFSNI
jgi:hypothetical protein